MSGDLRRKSQKDHSMAHTILYVTAIGAPFVAPVLDRLFPHRWRR
jgi:hypothetical protein